MTKKYTYPYSYIDFSENPAEKMLLPNTKYYTTITEKQINNSEKNLQAIHCRNWTLFLELGIKL